MAHTVTITIASAQHSFAAGTVSAGIKVTLGTLDPQAVSYTHLTLPTIYSV